MEQQKGRATSAAAEGDTGFWGVRWESQMYKTSVAHCGEPAYY